MNLSKKGIVFLSFLFLMSCTTASVHQGRTSRKAFSDLWLKTEPSVLEDASVLKVVLEGEADFFKGKHFVVHVLKKKIPFFQEKMGRWIALVPVPYLYKIKTKKPYLKLRIFERGKFFRFLRVLLKHRKYPRETLRVDPRRVRLNAKDLKRARREKKEIQKIYQNITLEPYFQKGVVRPLSSKITSVFGTKRFYNKDWVSYHSGVDFRAKVGTSIVAPIDGKVVLAKELFFTGNTVILNHGYGVFTIYGHMSRLDVKVGDFLERGDRLGLAGATGRVTGPHLHWGAVIFGVKIDPLKLWKMYAIENKKEQ